MDPNEFVEKHFSVVNIVPTPIVIKSKRYLKKTDETKILKEYRISSSLRVDRQLITHNEIPRPSTVYLIPSLNAVAVAQGHNTRIAWLRLSRLRVMYWAYSIPDTILPPPSSVTHVHDIEFFPGVILIRWPVLFYANPVITPEDQCRTLDRQRRESEFIEKSFPPLGSRREPYPFFTPEYPLDSLRSPAVNIESVVPERKVRAKRAKPPITGE
jgi:hypothetical protein